jgi:hypothetical protein
MAGIGMSELTPYQRRQFIKLLGKSYRSFSEIARLFWVEFGVDLANIVDLKSSITEGAGNLLAWAERSGRTRQLVMVLFRGGPTRPSSLQFPVAGEKSLESMSPQPTRAAPPTRGCT